jgi:hypothetical protein
VTVRPDRDLLVQLGIEYQPYIQDVADLDVIRRQGTDLAGVCRRRGRGWRKIRNRTATGRHRYGDDGQGMAQPERR